MTDKTRVYNIDCMIGMKEFPDKYFELAIVDPPYGLTDDITNGGGIRKKYVKSYSWDNSIPDYNYWQHLFRVSTNQIIWGANYFLHYIGPTRCMLIWDKVQEFSGADFELAWTSFDSPAKAFRMSRVEAHGSGVIHPTQKPTKLYKWLLKNYAKEGDKILDTHLGSGSSRIAAFDMGFDFTGYELDKDYFEGAEKRFQQHKAQLKLDFSPGTTGLNKEGLFR